MISGLDHVQVAAPPGCEAKARKFYGHVLGMKELEKPGPLGARGGVWFALGDSELHIGVEKDFHAARKAHPGARRELTAGARGARDAASGCGPPGSLGQRHAGHQALLHA